MPEVNSLGLTDEDMDDLEDLIGDGDRLDEIMGVMGGEVPRTRDDHTKVCVSKIPDCDFCENGTKARYDGKTVMGPWANMCQAHLAIYGIGLGLGKGQEYILDKED